MITTEKTCFKCLCKLPLEAFYKHSEMGDGHLNKCKECTKADAIKHRNEKIDYCREYDRRRASNPDRRAKARAVIEAWKEMHPDRRKAQIAVGNAVRDGRLKKLLCMVCGKKAEAHHPDYGRHLDVVWLCPAHHKQAHALVENTEYKEAP